MNRFRNEDYLAWLRTLKCCNCPQSHEIEAHHLKGRGNKSGSSLKAPDTWAMPLCNDCHIKMHAGDKAMLDSQPMWIAQTLALFIERTIEGLGKKSTKLLINGIGGD